MAGHVTVVPQRVIVPQEVATQVHPQRFGVVPPHVCPFVQVPQLSVPPQPSLISPQLAADCAHVRRRHESVPASAGSVDVHFP